MTGGKGQPCLPALQPIPAPAGGDFTRKGKANFASPYQRDRDRIIHSSGFRRLKHKTQVFVEHEGDYFRTRLTHSIEVAQVARTIAGALGLNSHLTEAVALAHDLGHTPFGHTGEDKLDELMTPFGGFDHNAQALKIVTSLERHYAKWDGLNLTWETLEGIAKHNGPVTGELPMRWPSITRSMIWNCPPMRGQKHRWPPWLMTSPITITTCMTGCGLGSSRWRKSPSCPLWAPRLPRWMVSIPDWTRGRRRHEALRRVFGVMVEDVLSTSQGLLKAANPQSVEDIRALDHAVIRFSSALWSDLKVIRKFLFTRMYRAPSVVEMRTRVTVVVGDLFGHFMAHPMELPEEWCREIEAAEGETALARLVSDYIAGMTDRFALQEHARLGLGG